MALKCFEAESKVSCLRRNVLTLTCIFWTSDSTEKNVSYLVSMSSPGMMAVIPRHPMFLNFSQNTSFLQSEGLKRWLKN